MEPSSETSIKTYDLQAKAIAAAAGIPVAEGDLVSIETDDGYALRVTVRSDQYNRQGGN